MLALAGTARAGVDELGAHRGRRVRVTLAAGKVRLEGRLGTVDPEGVVLLQRGGPRRLLFEQIGRVELLPRGRWRGMFVGAAVWGATAYALYDADADRDRTRWGQTGLGLVAGGLIGAIHDWSKQEKTEVLYEPPAEGSAESAEGSAESAEGSAESAEGSPEQPAASEPAEAEFVPFDREAAPRR